MFDLMQYALIFYDFQLILAQMGARPTGRRIGAPSVKGSDRDLRHGSYDVTQ
jgi:hypothetical protein